MMADESEQIRITEETKDKGEDDEAAKHVIDELKN